MMAIRTDTPYCSSLATGATASSACSPRAVPLTAGYLSTRDRARGGDLHRARDIRRLRQLPARDEAYVSSAKPSAELRQRGCGCRHPIVFWNHGDGAPLQDEGILHVRHQ